MVVGCRLMAKAAFKIVVAPAALQNFKNVS
jgi:hypothetical protein